MVCSIAALRVDRFFRSDLVNLAQRTLLATALLVSSVPYQTYARQVPTTTAVDSGKANSLFKADGSGTLIAMSSTGSKMGACPLEHTSVNARIAGYVARVQVKQVFKNNYSDKIEAIYTFPLSDTAAVDSMVMKVGERTIRGIIKKREEAREIYNQAKAHGHVASLLDQERPNIFTQSVANIEPGKTIEVTLEYVDLLPYEAGKYTFAFPTVVGPRFIPGSPIGHAGTGRLADTAEVPDASKITPPVPPAGTRAGHDISINVSIEAGVSINNVTSALHEITLTGGSGQKEATVSLKDRDTIPNKDFVLSWDVAADKLQSGYLTYRDPQKENSGYFTVMLLPPKKAAAESIAPKEMIFLIDCSGSQQGAPLTKAKETLSYIVKHMNKDDTFQIIAFNNLQSQLFDRPETFSPAMEERAQHFIDALEARGGTWMAPAVTSACSIPADKNRLRIVTFMTDGYVGNDFQIIGMVKKLRGNSRWFPFGTGNSVNRLLINKIAEEGGGEAEFVLLNSSGEEVGKKFYNRIASPLLTDVHLTCEGGNVKEVFPRDVSDVWAEKPLYFKGRYTEPGAGTITLTGYSGGKPYTQKLRVTFPTSNPTNEGIASMWARAKVDRLQSEDWLATQTGKLDKELKDEIVKTALDHHIMTQYTSFVAVEEKTITKDGQLKQVTVPVEIPDGVSRNMTIQEEQEGLQRSRNLSSGYIPYVSASGGGGGAFSSYGTGNKGASYAAPQPALMTRHGHYQVAPSYAVGDKESSYEKKRRTSEPEGRSTASESLAAKADTESTPSNKPGENVGKDESSKLSKDKGTSKIDSFLRQLLADRANRIHRPEIGKDGTIRLKIKLINLQPATLEKLKRIGVIALEQQKGSSSVVGSLKVEKILELQALPEVVEIESVVKIFR